tara:strand:- start:126 stop:644 length:519 start_codon:yes stop_codon:yes gene_type:complete
MFLSINNKFNITLCGMMGSGKSSVGRIIAKKIHYKFIDIDKLIEKKEKKKISKIFLENGEEYFRSLEEKITIDNLYNKKSIISLGGGAIINNMIRNTIKKNSFNIYLKVDIDTLKKRLEKSTNRPLIIDKNLNKTLDELLKNREQFYNKADLVISNEISITNTVEEILNKIR